MGIAAKSMELMSGAGGDAAKLDEGGKGINAARAEYDAQIKGLLGEEKMKKLEQYERTVGDRMQMQQYQQALTASGVPLENKQRDELMNVMKEERLKMPPSPFEGAGKDASAQFKAMQSPERIDELMKMTTDFNAKVLERARQILTPAQLNTFQSAQEQQVETMKMGMKMSQQMFGGGNKGTRADDSGKPQQNK
jgi:hypothetical protein